MEKSQDENWEILCKRTNDPKLSWLERKLDEAGISHRRNGHSWHAPILEVLKTQIDQAWKILPPVDDIPDDDEMFIDQKDSLNKAAGMWKDRTDLQDMADIRKGWDRKNGNT